MMFLPTNRPSFEAAGARCYSGAGVVNCLACASRRVCLPMPASVTVRVPATSANLGPGFDALGIALSITGEVTVSVDSRGGGRQESRADGLALHAARTVFQKAGRQPPIGLR